MTHGITVTESPTVGRPPITSLAGLPVYVGTAPINRGEEDNVNKINICYSFDEAKTALGYDEDFEDYTLCSAMKLILQKYKAGPLVLINVLDPGEATHINTGITEAWDLGTLGEPSQVFWELKGILPSTVVITNSAVPSTYTEGTDYTLEIDEDTGFLQINIIAAADGGTIPSDLATLAGEADQLLPSGVVQADIIGAMTAGVSTGLYKAHHVYSKTGLVPGMLRAPYWGRIRAVKDEIKSIALNIAGEFRCHGVVDLDHQASEIANYTAVPTWKADNFYYDKGMVNCWGPRVEYDDEYYLLGDHYVAQCLLTDASDEAGGIPYISPSNKIILADALVDDSDNEVLFTKPNINTINDQGVVGAVPTRFGFRLWGNRTAIYPSDSDPREAFIPIRRMFDWVHNSLVLTHEAKVDSPGNKKQIQSVVRAEQLRINGLISAGALIAGRVAFLETENPIDDLMDGKVKYHVWLTPPVPMEDIQFIVEYDPDGIAAVFA